VKNRKLKNTGKHEKREESGQVILQGEGIRSRVAGKGKKMEKALFTGNRKELDINDWVSWAGGHIEERKKKKKNRKVENNEDRKTQIER